MVPVVLRFNPGVLKPSKTVWVVLIFNGAEYFLAILTGPRRQRAQIVTELFRVLDAL